MGNISLGSESQLPTYCEAYQRRETIWLKIFFGKMNSSQTFFYTRLVWFLITVEESPETQMLESSIIFFFLMNW